MSAKYRPPKNVKIGDRLQSALGQRLVTHLLPTPIGPWPACDLDANGRRRGGKPTPILYGDLLLALRERTVGDVAELWGLSRKAAAKYARAIGIDTRRSAPLRERRRELAAAGVGLPGDARRKAGLAENFATRRRTRGERGRPSGRA